MYWIETDYIWFILKKVGPTFFKIREIAWIKVVFFPQNHFICDVTIILSVKEFYITIFEFKLVIN